MKLSICFNTVMAICLLSQSAHADYSGKFTLDQSKDVYFEQLSTTDFSLQLLKVKDKFDSKTLVMGGVGEIDWQHWQGDKIATTPPENYHTDTQLYFTQATIDLMANYTHWINTFLSISDNHIGQGGPDGNYVYIPHAFILLGNLTQSPFYFTVGINSIAFGNFAGSGVWNSPLTLNYFDPQPSPQVSLGFFKYNWDLSTTFYSDSTNHDNHVVVNLNYNNTYHDFNYGIGAGYINDLKSNATGDPATISRKRRFSVSNDMGAIWDANATLGYKLFSLTGEYLTGSEDVARNTENPEAFDISLSYTPTISGKTTTFGLSRSFSWHLKDIPTSLAGQNAIPLVASGIKNITAISVSRPIFISNLQLGFDAEKAVTYADKQTFTYTLDLLAYL